MEILKENRKLTICLLFVFCLFIWKISVCGARYKTRPGLTYHYGHSHKEGASDDSRDSTAPNPPSQMGGPIIQTAAGAAAAPTAMATVANNDNFDVAASNAAAAANPVLSSALMGGGMGVGDQPPAPNPTQGPPNQGHVYQDSYVSFLNQTPGTYCLLHLFYSFFIILFSFLLFYFDIYILHIIHDYTYLITIFLFECKIACMSSWNDKICCLFRNGFSFYILIYFH